MYCPYLDICPYMGIYDSSTEATVFHKSFSVCRLHINEISRRMVGVMHLLAANRTGLMLRITTEKRRGKVFLSVEGKLAGPWVAALEQCWRELHASSQREKFHVNLCGVSFIDAAGKVLLKEVHRQGGQLVAEGCLNQAIVKEITASDKSEGRGENGKDSKGAPIIFYLMLLGLLVGASGVHAQDKRPETTQNQAAGEPLKLTLDKAVGLALKQNPSAQIAVLQ